MVRDKKSFRRLPGRGRRPFSLTGGAARLYLEEDHLLCITNHRFAESYKRFYFRDIQALVLAKTDAGKSWNIFLVVAVVVLAAFTSAVWGSSPVAWSIIGTIITFLLVLLIMNSVRGPTCTVQLRTAVTTEELPSLGRLRVAQRVLDLLRPVIEAAQGQLTIEEVQSKAMELSSGVTSNVLSAGRPAGAQIAAVRHEKGAFHTFVFLLLLLDGLSACLQLAFGNLPLTVLGYGVTMGLTVMTIVALVRQHGSDISQGLRGVTWATAGYIGLSFLFGFVFAMYLMAEHQLSEGDQLELMRLFVHEMDMRNPALVWAFSIFATIAFILALMGFLVLRGHRRRTATPPALGAATQEPARPPTPPAHRNL